MSIELTGSPALHRSSTGTGTFNPAARSCSSMVRAINGLPIVYILALAFNPTRAIQAL